MAVPKRKMSRSNTRSRRANWKATVVGVTAPAVAVVGDGTPSDPNIAFVAKQMARARLAELAAKHSA